MPLPADFYDEGVNYRIRLCILLDENPLAGLSNGSKVHPCDSCERPIWVHEAQVMPPMPEGMELTGDVSVCGPCMAHIHARAKEDEVTWIGEPPPPSVVASIKKEYGI